MGADLGADIELVLRENDRLRDLLGVLSAEKARLEEHFLAARSELQARLAEAEQQYSNIAHLFVAKGRLQGTRQRRDVLEAIHDIVSNLIGSQEAAIFESSENGRTLSLVGCFGIEPDPYRQIQFGEGHIGRCAQRGETYLATPSGAARRTGRERDLTACIPLKADGRVVGALALFRLLPHKAAGLTPLDHELLELLATHAASALNSTAEWRPDAVEATPCGSGPTRRAR